MSSRTVNIGLLGLGTIGSGVVRLLRTRADLILRRTGLALQLARVADRDPSRAREVGVEAQCFTTDCFEVLRDPEIHVVVELIGGQEPAGSFLFEAIRNGKHVVTANKEVVSKRWEELHREAASHGVCLNFSASAGGAVPIVSAVRDRLVADRVEEILGVLNGTTNFVLTRMSEHGDSMAKAVATAQDRGYAEADPSQDLAGKDTARKLAILAQSAFHVSVEPDAIFTEGIGSIQRCDLSAAEAFGYVVKLLAVAKAAAEGPELRVHPALIPRDHPLASARNEENAVYLRSEAVGESMLLGKGAGSLPTATAVLADVADAALRRPPRASQSETDGREPLDIGKAMTRAYLRFTVADRAGAIGRITTVLGEQGINISSVHASLYEDCAGWGHVELITQTAPESKLRAAFETAKTLDGVGAPASLIRIEGESGKPRWVTESCAPGKRFEAVVDSPSGNAAVKNRAEVSVAG